MQHAFIQGETAVYMTCKLQFHVAFHIVTCWINVCACIICTNCWVFQSVQSPCRYSALQRQKRLSLLTYPESTELPRNKVV